MNEVLKRIQSVIRNYRLIFGNELELQNCLAQIFKDAGFLFYREFEMSKTERPDFFMCEKVTNLAGIAIEVKVAGSIATHLRQMKRYANHESVLGVILIGTRPFSMPTTLSGKPVALVNVGGNRL